MAKRRKEIPVRETIFLNNTAYIFAPIQDTLR